MDIATLAVLGAAFVISQQKQAPAAATPPASATPPAGSGFGLDDVLDLAKEAREWWNTIQEAMPPSYAYDTSTLDS